MKLLNTLFTLFVGLIGFAYAGWIGAIVLAVVYIIGIDILGEILGCIFGSGDCGGQV